MKRRNLINRVFAAIVGGALLSFAFSWCLGNVRGISSFKPFLAASTEQVNGSRTVTIRPMDSAKYLFTTEQGVKDYVGNDKRIRSEAAASGRKIVAGAEWIQVDWRDLPGLVRRVAVSSEPQSGLAQGWPFRAHFGVTTAADPFDYPSYRGLFSLGRGSQAWTFTYFVYWPLFLLNVACYGVGLFGIMSLAGWLRIRLRKLKGSCRTCGYNIAGSPTSQCPECGSSTSR